MKGRKGVRKNEKTYVINEGKKERRKESRKKRKIRKQRKIYIKEIKKK